MASKRIKGITIEIEGKATKLVDAIKDVEKQANAATADLKDINKLLKFDPKNTELLAQKQKALTDAIDGTKKKLEEEKRALEQLENGPQTDETVRQQELLQREIADTEHQLESLENEFKEFGSVAAQQSRIAGEHMQEIGKNVEEAGRGIQSAGRGLTTYVTAPIVAAGTASFMNFAEVDKIMTLTNKTMGNTEEQAQMLSKAMQDAASNSTYGMTEAANATLNFARAGLSAEEAAAALAPAMNLAAGEGGNLDTVSAGLVGTINGFGDPFSEATHYADVFAAACNNSALDVDSLANSMGVAAPVFNAAGKSIEDAALYLGIMAQQDIEANVAANALKTGLMRLADAPKAAQKAMEKYNIAITDVWGPDGSMKDAVSIQKNLHDSFARLNKQEKLAAASAIFGKNQAAAWLSLIDAAPEWVDDFSKSLKNASGTTKEMAEAMMSGPGGSVERLKSSIDVLSHSFGELTANYVQPLIDKLQELVDTLQAMDPEAKDAVIRIAGVAAVIGPVLMVIGSLVVGIGKLIWAVGKIKVALAGSAAAAEGATAATAGLGGSIAGLLGPIAAVATAIAIWVHNWDEIKEAGQLLVERTQEHLAEIRDAWREVSDALAVYVPAKWNEIKNKASAALTGIQIGCQMVGDQISGIFTSKVEFIKGIIDGGFGFVYDTIKAKLQSAYDFLSNILDDIKGAFEFLVDLARTWGENLINNFLGGINTKIDFAKTMVKGIGDKIQETLNIQDTTPNTAAMQTPAGSAAWSNAAARDYSGQLASINNGIGQLATAGGGDIIIPVNIGQQKLDNIVVRANQRNNFRSGGR